MLHQPDISRVIDTLSGACCRVTDEALSVMKARLQAIEEKFETQAHNSLEDAQYTTALGEGMAHLLEEVACLKKAIETIEHHGSPPMMIVQQNIDFV